MAEDLEHLEETPEAISDEQAFDACAVKAMESAKVRRLLKGAVAKYGAADASRRIIDHDPK